MDLDNQAEESTGRNNHWNGYMHFQSFLALIFLKDVDGIKVWHLKFSESAVE